MGVGHPSLDSFLPSLLSPRPHGCQAGVREETLGTGLGFAKTALVIYLYLPWRRSSFCRNSLSGSRRNSKNWLPAA